MPIRLNLLAEAQAAEESRRKDPVKRSIWIGGFVVFLVVLAGATLQFKIIAARSDVNALQAQWKAIEKQVQQINEHRNNTRDLEHRLSALDQFTTNRMLWANAFNALQHIPFDNVHLINVRTEQTFTLNESTRRTNEHGIAVGKGPSVTEKITINLEGKDYADKVQSFKQSLADHTYFQTRLHQTNKIQLTSLSAPQIDGGRTYRSFGLQLFFDEKERVLHE
jgi:hypothetical protein